MMPGEGGEEIENQGWSLILFLAGNGARGKRRQGLAAKRLKLKKSSAGCMRFSDSNSPFFLFLILPFGGSLGDL